MHEWIGTSEAGFDEIFKNGASTAAPT